MIKRSFLVEISDTISIASAAPGGKNKIMTKQKQDGFWGGFSPVCFSGVCIAGIRASGSQGSGPAA
jgi:hypothetical protein